MCLYNLTISLILFGCTLSTEKVIDPPESNLTLANVIAVEAKGDPEEYTFTVTLKSPDTGCDQYADWWEIITPDGELIYRRILSHSHVNEQPFSRSGTPVKIQMDQVVFVRAHMNNSGYGGQAMTGSASVGFKIAPLSGYEELETEDPLPGKCEF